MHFSCIQQHFGYDIPQCTEFVHPLPPIGPPFAAQSTPPQPVTLEPGSSSLPDGHSDNDGNDGNEEEDTEEGEDSEKNEYCVFSRGST